MVPVRPQVIRLAKAMYEASGLDVPWTLTPWEDLEERDRTQLIQNAQELIEGALI